MNLDLGSWILDFGSWILEFGSWNLHFALRIADCREIYRTVAGVICFDRLSMTHGRIGFCNTYQFIFLHLSTSPSLHLSNSLSLQLNTQSQRLPFGTLRANGFPSGHSEPTASLRDTQHLGFCVVPIEYLKSHNPDQAISNLRRIMAPCRGKNLLKCL